MQRPRVAAAVTSVWLTCGWAAAAPEQQPAPKSPAAPGEESRVEQRAQGTFDVKLTPQAAGGAAEGTPLGRMTIDKQFHGDLEGTSQGEMLTAVTGVDGSAGYVALEKVSGRLHGRRGTFVLQHTGVMTRGAPQLTIAVVPDSATGELAGLAGRMSIEITGGKHSYDFAYTLSGAR